MSPQVPAELLNNGEEHSLTHSVPELPFVSGRVFQEH